ncbi:hypothetical protein JB92DRAFT_3059081 [Gautieria morchelliformis]|nr:hypothetical protein JB92DRAFT_3059081 [Gautieria morchelliformis]
MPRRTAVVEDEDDSVPLDDLLRTGEASRLRRRGAVRATAHRRDEEDPPMFPCLRSLQEDGSHLELECGVRSAECSFAPAGSSRPSPLPCSPPARKASDVGFAFSSTGCGAVVSTKASPCIIGTQPVYSVETMGADTALLHPDYLDVDQRAFADALIRDVPRYDWDAIGCRVCGNALGIRYAACLPHIGKTDPTYVFLPSSVTPSPNFTFPAIPAIQHPESDDMSIDSPTFSPRVTRYFRSDDEFWGTEINPLWTPERGFTPTPPRSPPPVATPSAYTWDAVLPPSASTQTQTRASRTTDAPRHRESTNPVPGHEPFNPRAAWQSFFRSISPRRRERPPQNISEASHAAEMPQPPSDPGAALPNEQRDSASVERPRVPRTDTVETNPRPLDPPSLHRVSRRLVPPVPRRATPLDWSSRGRYPSVSDANSSWAVPAPDERTSRRMPPTRRMTMPVSVTPSAPLPPFTLLDASGERSYPPSVRSSIDARDMLGVSVEAETNEDVVAPGLMQERESESHMERPWNPDPNGENEGIGSDDSEDKEDDLDERLEVENDVGEQGRNIVSQLTESIYDIEEQGRNLLSQLNGSISRLSQSDLPGTI